MCAQNREIMGRLAGRLIIAAVDTSVLMAYAKGTLVKLKYCRDNCVHQLLPAGMGINALIVGAKDSNSVYDAKTDKRFTNILVGVV